MVVDCKEKRAATYNLQTFLKDIGCSDMQLKLLRFWAQHPKVKLGIYTVARVLDSLNNSFRGAITALAEKGVLTAEHDSNGLTIYALSQQLSQEYINELAALDRSQMLTLEKKLQGGL